MRREQERRGSWSLIRTPDKWKGCIGERVMGTDKIRQIAGPIGLPGSTLQRLATKVARRGAGRRLWPAALQAGSWLPGDRSGRGCVDGGQSRNGGSKR